MGAAVKDTNRVIRNAFAYQTTTRKLFSIIISRGAPVLRSLSKRFSSLYAILSGHNGVTVAENALQEMAAELLLGQLNVCNTDEAVKELIRQSFMSVEKGYFDSINPHVATKTAIQLHLSADGMNQYEISQQFENVLQKLDSLNNALSVGSSAVLALIHRSHLYLGNIGNCRALKS